jgi:HD-GYP domain-containing protein (c-di-GMP phosphodiesterase class II)
VRMGRSHDMVEGLRLAGLIHDMGKIRVPVEILGSTRCLTTAEFEIVKTHPAIGYEVLRDISFRWPIAETVYQHHERLDGSGYPRGLKGNRIIMEARILGVADVVEAIASERPYRKALGIQAALERIVSDKGRLFDPEVVDACLEVFQKDGYVLGQEPLLDASEDH